MLKLPFAHTLVTSPRENSFDKKKRLGVTNIIDDGHNFCF